MSGRPCSIIDGDAILRYREVGLPWTNIATLIGVCDKTLYTWRKEVEFVDPREKLADDETIDCIVRQYTDSQPARGSSTIWAHLKSINIDVTRERVRESIHRVDPEGVEQRKRRTVRRREYNITAPFALWHFDGHHKLIKFGIVVHGCIDGASRTIIYLEAKNNNRSATVLDLFRDGVSRFRLPARVRCDKGKENVLVVDFMLYHRDINSHPAILGSSNHNTRIERLWRDVRERVLDKYIELFHCLVNHWLIEEDGLVDRWILHHMFLPLISADLQQFVQTYNNHSIRTEHNQTPLQILALRENEAVPIGYVDDDYGAEDPEQDGDEDDGAMAEVVAPGLLNPFEDGEAEEEFRHHCPAVVLGDSSNTYVNRFVNAKTYVVNYLNHINNI